MIADAILVLVAIGWIGYRQMTWRVVDPSRMWRMPVVLAVVGAGILVTGDKASILTPIDVTALAVELVVGLGIGAVMGAIAHFRPLSSAAIEAYEAHRRDGRGVGAAVAYESRTGWVGLALWFVMIAVRVGLDVAAAHLGAAEVVSTGVILLIIAANRAARVAVFAYRLQREPQRVAA